MLYLSTKLLLFVAFLSSMKEGIYLKTRVISAIVLIVLVVACFAISPATRALLIVAAMITAIWEMCRAISMKEIKCAAWVLYVYAAVSSFAVYIMAEHMTTEVLFFLAVFAVLTAGVTRRDIRGPGSLASLAILVYPVVPFLIILNLALSPVWIPIFAIGCISTWACDAFALFGGKWFGKNKLAPEVSPKKTIEGSITGAVAATIVGGILYFVLKASYDIPLVICMLTALISSTFGQVGDLAASLIKRMCGVKDYSNLIPGHGGVMDRVDSLLFSIPVTYFILSICIF